MCFQVRRRINLTSVLSSNRLKFSAFSPKLREDVCPYAQISSEALAGVWLRRYHRSPMAEDSADNPNCWKNIYVYIYTYT